MLAGRYDTWCLDLAATGVGAHTLGFGTARKSCLALPQSVGVRVGKPVTRVVRCAGFGKETAGRTPVGRITYLAQWPRAILRHSSGGVTQASAVSTSVCACVADEG